MKKPFLVVPIPVTRVSMHEGKVDLVLVGAACLHGGQRPITHRGPSVINQMPERAPRSVHDWGNLNAQRTTYIYRSHLKSGSFFYYDMITNTVPPQ